MIGFFHNILVTLFMIIAYPIVAILSLIAMVIRFEEFSSIKETNRVWADTLKQIWSKQKAKGRI